MSVLFKNTKKLQSYKLQSYIFAIVLPWQKLNRSVSIACIRTERKTRERRAHEGCGIFCKKRAKIGVQKSRILAILFAYAIKFVYLCNAFGDVLR